MSNSNGFKLRGLNQAANRVAVQSSLENTWMLTRRSDGETKWHDVGMHQNELKVIKCQDGAESAELEIKPLGDKAGTLIADSSRHGARVLRVGQSYVFVMAPGEALVLRTSLMVAPTGPGAGMSA